MNPEDLVKEYLQQVKIMQLATAVGSQPWLCTLHYYSDDDLNFYWVSTTERKHSKQIAVNPQAAAYILVHENTPAEPYVIGISVTGTAELLGEVIDTSVAAGYARKQNKPENFLPDIASGANPHKFYRLKPTQIVLFDNKNFPLDPRQEVVL